MHKHKKSARLLSLPKRNPFYFLCHRVTITCEPSLCLPCTCKLCLCHPTPKVSHFSMCATACRKNKQNATHRQTGVCIQIESTAGATAPSSTQNMMHFLPLCDICFYKLPSFRFFCWRVKGRKIKITGTCKLCSSVIHAFSKGILTLSSVNKLSSHGPFRTGWGWKEIALIVSNSPWWGMEALLRGF